MPIVKRLGFTSVTLDNDVIRISHVKSMKKPKENLDLNLKLLGYPTISNLKNTCKIYHENDTKDVLYEFVGYLDLIE